MNDVCGEIKFMQNLLTVFAPLRTQMCYVDKLMQCLGQIKGSIYNHVQQSGPIHKILFIQTVGCLQLL